MNNSKNTTNRLPFLELLFYGLAVIALIAWKYVSLPKGVIDAFTTLWMAAVFAIPLGVAAQKCTPLIRGGIFLIWTPIAVLAQIALFHYHLYGVGFTLFALMWTLLGQYQIRKVTGKERVKGVIFRLIVGGIFFGIGLFVLLGQIHDARTIWTFKHLSAADIHRIEFQRESDKSIRHISEPMIIETLVASFPHTYPYTGRGSRFGAQPWTVRIFRKEDSSSPLVFRIGKGTRSQSDVVWLKFKAVGYHDYRNWVLYTVLTQKLTPELWNLSEQNQEIEVSQQ